MVQPDPVPAAVAAAYARQLGHAVNPATLRKWVQRRHIRRIGRDRYDLTEIHRHVTGKDPYHEA